MTVTVSGCNLIFKSTDTTSVQEQTSQSSKTTESVTESTTQTTTTQESATTSTVTDKLKEIEDRFNEIDWNTDNIEKIIKFIDENISSANQDLADTMVYTVMKLCEEYKFAFTDKFSPQEIQTSILNLSSSGEIDMEKLKNTDNQEIRGLITEALNKKYKLMIVEGFVMPLVDYQAYDAYRQYLSKEMNDYIEIKLDESNRPSVLDAGIVIPIDDFIQRILKSYNYLENYPDSPRSGEVKQFNQGRMQVYLGGIDNNPVFDSNNKILPEKLTEFKNNSVKYSGTEFAVMLNSYLELLKQENYLKTQKIDEFLNQQQQIIYTNTQYAFSFLLPLSWGGYSVIFSEWEGLNLGGDVPIEKGQLISIRHPEWTEANPRQDIPIMVFTIAQWDSLQQEKFHIGAAPVGPSELGRNTKYVFALPARYNYAFPTGYEEVDKILESKPLQTF